MTQISKCPKSNRNKPPFSNFQAFTNIMTLIRLVHRASLLTSMAFASLFVHSNPARADLSCIVADNGKAMCGTPMSIPRMCISTGNGKTACGKFTTIKKEGESSTQSLEPRPETNKPFTGSGQRKEADKFVFLLKGCRRIDTNIKCELTISNKGAERITSMIEIELC